MRERRLWEVRIEGCGLRVGETIGQGGGEETLVTRAAPELSPRLLSELEAAGFIQRVDVVPSSSAGPAGLSGREQRPLKLLA